MRFVVDVNSLSLSLLLLSVCSSTHTHTHLVAPDTVTQVHAENMLTLLPHFVLPNDAFA